MEPEEVCEEEILDILWEVAVAAVARLYVSPQR